MGINSQWNVFSFGLNVKGNMLSGETTKYICKEKEKDLFMCIGIM